MVTIENFPLKIADFLSIYPSIQRTESAFICVHILTTFRFFFTTYSG